MQVQMRKTLLALLDFILVGLSVGSTYFLRFGWEITKDQISEMIIFALITAVMTVAMMNAFRLYNRVWQYASISELWAILRAIAISSIFAFITMTFIRESGHIPYSVLIRTFETNVLLIGGSRFIWRLLVHQKQMRKEPDAKRALIIGAGDCGVLVAKELLANTKSGIKPVAFIDDNPFKRRNRIMDLPVIDDRHGIRAAVQKHCVDEIILAMPSASKKEVQEILQICKTTTAKLKIVPDIRAFINGKATLNAIREVNVEDLLGRDPIDTDIESIVSYVTKRTVLITGAGGSIGSELSRQIASYAPDKLLLLGHGENSIYLIQMELQQKYPQLDIRAIIADVQDKARIQEVFEQHKPNVVFHAAAHKHVPLMEENPAEAIKNNVIGTKNVAEAADMYLANRFVLISTDKAVNPTSVMGTTKRIAEMFVQAIGKSSATKFVVVRFGNVLGSRGSVIPRFKEQIEQGGPVTVTHPDMIRYFMTIPEAVQLVLQAGAMANGGEVYTLDMGEPVRIVKLAEDIIALSGFEPYKDIKITFTGIRPGEKLFEELYLKQETMHKTTHCRIYQGKGISSSQEEVESEIRKLEMTLGEPSEKIKGMLHKVVPNYMSVS
jgi:FlaA1/EpsC-like NDP-sugar epimerase